MKNKWLSGLFAAVLTVSAGTTVFAQGENYSAFEQQIKELQQRLDKVEQNGIKLAEAESLLGDFIIGGGITLILQNAQNANGDPANLYNGKTPTVGSYSIDLEFEKSFDEHNMAFLHLETGQGDIAGQLSVFSGVNRDADESEAAVSVTEAWFQHKFAESGFALTVGKIDATTGIDDNAFANDETSQFLGCAFRNSDAINLPEDNSFGAQLSIETSNIDVMLQYLGAKETFEDITRDIFASAQVNFKPVLISDMDSNYRVYAWTNTRNYGKWSDPAATGEKNYGLGISFDQQITDIIGAFARYSWGKTDVRYPADHSEEAYPISQNWSLGLQFNVSGLGKEDVIGVAYGQVIPSDDYKKSLSTESDTENHTEIYYSWNINDYLSVSPDIQMIENPAGNSNNDTIFVSSIRMQISF